MGEKVSWWLAFLRAVGLAPRPARKPRPAPKPTPPTPPPGPMVDFDFFGPFLMPGPIVDFAQYLTIALWRQVHGCGATELLYGMKDPMLKGVHFMLDAVSKKTGTRYSIFDTTRTLVNGMWRLNDFFVMWGGYTGLEPRYKGPIVSPASCPTPSPPPKPTPTPKHSDEVELTIRWRLPNGDIHSWMTDLIFSLERACDKDEAGNVVGTERLTESALKSRFLT